MKIDLDIDISALVGEMEALPCEAIDHAASLDVHDDGPATHYARVHCAACGLNVVKPYCAKFIDAIQWCPFSECRVCGYESRTSELITVIGPVKL